VLFRSDFILKYIKTFRRKRLKVFYELHLGKRIKMNMRNWHILIYTVVHLSSVCCVLHVLNSPVCRTASASGQFKYQTYTHPRYFLEFTAVVLYCVALCTSVRTGAMF